MTHKNSTYERTTGPDSCLYRMSKGKRPNIATWVTRYHCFPIVSVNWRSGIRREGYAVNSL